jgi:CheY-like chemotaxis protein
MFLESLGHKVVATAGRLDQAVELAGRADIDFALLDLNLGGVRTYPVADALEARKIPYAFATGYGASGIAPEYAHIQTLSKPFRIEDVAALLDRTLRQAPSQSGTSKGERPPWPTPGSLTPCARRAALAKWARARWRTCIPNISARPC